MQPAVAEQDLVPLMALMESCSPSWSGSRAGGYQECLRASLQTHQATSGKGLADSLPCSPFRKAPPPHLTLSLLQLSFQPFFFPNSLQSGQLPSVLYMPFKCVSVAAGVFECACVRLRCIHNRVVVFCFSCCRGSLPHFYSHSQGGFPGLVGFFQPLEFRVGELYF